LIDAIQSATARKLQLSHSDFNGLLPSQRFKRGRYKYPRRRPYSQHMTNNVNVKNERIHYSIDDEMMSSSDDDGNWQQSAKEKRFKQRKYAHLLIAC